MPSVVLHVILFWYCKLLLWEFKGSFLLLLTGIWGRSNLRRLEGAPLKLTPFYRDSLEIPQLGGQKSKGQLSGRVSSLLQRSVRFDPAIPVSDIGNGPRLQNPCWANHPHWSFRRPAFCRSGNICANRLENTVFTVPTSFANK